MDIYFTKQLHETLQVSINYLFIHPKHKPVWFPRDKTEKKKNFLLSLPLHLSYSTQFSERSPPSGASKQRVPSRGPHWGHL